MIPDKKRNVKQNLFYNISYIETLYSTRCECRYDINIQHLLVSIKSALCVCVHSWYNYMLVITFMHGYVHVTCTQKPALPTYTLSPTTPVHIFCKKNMTVLKRHYTIFGQVHHNLYDTCQGRICLGNCKLRCICHMENQLWANISQLDTHLTKLGLSPCVACQAQLGHLPWVCQLLPEKCKRKKKEANCLADMEVDPSTL